MNLGELLENQTAMVRHAQLGYVGGAQERETLGHIDLAVKKYGESADVSEVKAKLSEELDPALMLGRLSYLEPTAVVDARHMLDSIDQVEKNLWINRSLPEASYGIGNSLPDIELPDTDQRV